MNLTLAQAAAYIATPSPAHGERRIRGYSIDSRTVQPGEIYFAVRGERFDGHDFAASALANGAAAAVVSRTVAVPPDDRAKLLQVEDPLLALQTLATSVRRLWGKTVVGVTGSAGKTTTKEAVAHLLEQRFNVFKSQGNLNNHFGLPLQLLRLQPEHDIAVLEMGMSHAGEISALAAMACPQVGVVTNVSAVHLDFFDSIEGIARAKYELIAALPVDGVAVLNADDEYVSKFDEGFAGKVAFYGLSPAATVHAQNIESRGFSGSSFDLVIEGRPWGRVDLPLIGAHNIRNVLAAATVAWLRGLSPAEIAQGIAGLTPPQQRGETLQVRGATVINDCYNSNPAALNSMVEALSTVPAIRRLVVAGEMLELGPAGTQLHRDCGTIMAERKVDCVLGVRGLAREIVAGASAAGVRGEFVETPEAAGGWLSRELRAGDAVLLKASRGVRLEKALEILLAGESAGENGPKGVAGNETGENTENRKQDAASKLRL